MRKYHDQGIWEIFIPGLVEGDIYKYEIAVEGQDLPLLKADPYAFIRNFVPGTPPSSRTYQHL
jgi:1,4-alpha-glucan branching enzyme